jgi:S1-C subfamily serine protease/peptidoglycan hydrolase-like protein with peptidoglycan-binding domain
MRNLAVFFLLACSAATAVDASRCGAVAEAAQPSMSFKERLLLQYDLAGAGDYSGLIDGEIGQRTLKAVREFQRRQGWRATGTLSPVQRARLSDLAGRAFADAGYTRVWDPAHRQEFSVPTKLTPNRTASKRAMRYSSSTGSIEIETVRMPAGESTLDGLFAKLATSSSGRTVDYQVRKANWFVIAGQHGKRNFYARFHATASGDLVGFSYAYPTVEASRLGRIATILSNSFEIDMSVGSDRLATTDTSSSPLALTSGEFWVIVASRIDLNEAIDVARGFAWNFPHTFVAEASNGRYAIVVGRVEGEKWQGIKHEGISSGLLPADTFATRGEKLVAVKWEPEPVADEGEKYEPPAPTGSDAEPPRLDAPLTSSGTGFLVTARGHILTNAHVVRGCTVVQIGSSVTGDVAARDEQNDLAVVQMRGSPPSTAPLPFSTEGAALGAKVAALGYPLQDVLAAGLNITEGNVSSLAGLRGDTRKLQITAPIQAGNSGGPLVNDRGHVVGIVTSTVDPLKMAAAVGELPQSLNFAIRAEVVQVFLSAHGIYTRWAGKEQMVLSLQEIAAKVGPATLPLQCDPL